MSWIAVSCGQYPKESAQPDDTTPTAHFDCNAFVFVAGRLAAIIEKAQREMFTIEIDEEMAPIIIGRKGATITKLQEDSGCRINVDKGSGLIRVRGDESKLPAARCVPALRRDSAVVPSLPL